MAPTVTKIVLHPIKSCQGVSVRSAVLHDTGFLYDRAWCVVDVVGTRQARLESISQRKLPKLATVAVAIDTESGVLQVTANGMPALTVPLEESKYERYPEVAVQCSGVSTTDGGGWHLGACPGRSAGPEAEKWFSEYLNRPHVQPSKKPPARYQLVRSMSATARRVSAYAGPAQQPDSPFQFQHLNVNPVDRVRYQDFAPFLVVSHESISDLNSRMGTKTYPVESFRGNIVVGGTDGPWDEETWAEYTIRGVPFRFLKECPRCTVPGRNQQTGEYHFKGGRYDGVEGKLLTPQNTLSAAFPEQVKDLTWGTWAGPFFGAYAAADPGAVGAVISVGDPIAVQLRRRGRAGLGPSLQGTVVLRVVAVALLLVVAVALAVASGAVPSLPFP